MKPTFVILILFFISSIKAQVNLVVDPSFELNKECDQFLWIRGTKLWHSLDSTNNTSTPNSGCTPVYANTCSTYSQSSLPNNYATGTLSYKYPRTGEGMYISLFYLDPAVNPGYNRDYLRGLLKGYLASNQQYCGKFYVSLYKTMKYGVDRFGAYLDNGSLDVNNECLPIVVTPNFENPTFNIITDTIGWTKIEGIFTANGSEKYITIGNFYSNANTNRITFNPSSTWDDAYYYVDDVSIIPITTKAYAGNDQTLCLGDSTTLGRPQEIGLECLWYTPGNPTPFSSNSDITFKPTATGSYTLVQKMDNCVVSLDTVVVTVVDDCEFTTDAPNVFTPNEDGINDVWKVNTGKYSGSISCTVFNRWGIKVHEHSPETATIIQWDGSK